jgi:hypothetical protein
MSVQPQSTWPELPYRAWKDSLATLHLWTQIVGKIRLVTSPWVNQAWHVTLYPTARGLTTSPMAIGDWIFEIDFDFLAHRLVIRTGGGDERILALRPMAVADFYRDVLGELESLGRGVRIHRIPNEIPDAIPFDEDRVHAAYDPPAVTRFFRALAQADRVFKQFRANFTGKCSPVHFFWGSFDLAVTRFSGRAAPRHPAGVPNMPDWVAREAYSEEVSSAGFWLGGEAHPEPIFYSYAYPAPDGFAAASVEPGAATFHEGLGEFVLPYEAVRTAADPDAALLAFLESTYEAAADLATWDRDRFTRGNPRVRFA